MKYLKYYESKFFNCTAEQLTKLPEIPDDTEELYCHYNNLTKLPKLPSNLRVLDCRYNDLTELPELPDTLIVLNCQMNQIDKLPKLPPNLRVLECYGNDLKEIPELPYTLTDFNCNGNQFTKPIKIEIMNKFYYWCDKSDGGYGYDIENLYTENQITKFSSYEFQKEFLDEDESRWQDLKPFGFPQKIRDEYPWIFDADAMGLL